MNVTSHQNKLVDKRTTTLLPVGRKPVAETGIFLRSHGINDTARALSPPENSKHRRQPQTAVHAISHQQKCSIQNKRYTRYHAIQPIGPAAKN